MRALALVLAFLALAGCKSGRDYTSVNNRSVNFLFDTFRHGNQVRKKSLKEDLAFGQRAPRNKRVRKESREFAWQSFWEEEGSGLRDLLHAPAAESKGKAERLASMRFGFLDSGE
jgi:hypothetical protein